jgi:hypothetical protein
MVGHSEEKFMTSSCRYRPVCSTEDELSPAAPESCHMGWAPSLLVDCVRLSAEVSP